jgi:hypothetical protein
MFPVCSQSRSPNAPAKRGCSQCSAFFRWASMYEWRPQARLTRTATRNRGTVGTRNRVEGLHMERTGNRTWNNWPWLRELLAANRAEEPLVTDIGCVRLLSVIRGSYRDRMIRSCGDRAVQQLLDREFRRKFQAIEKAARVRLPSWVLQPRFGIRIFRVCTWRLFEAMTLAKEEKPMPTKRSTKRTTATAATTPMTVADAFEAGRRAYEAAAGSTGTAAPTAEPRRAPAIPSRPAR